jgi:hypothetical protein
MSVGPTTEQLPQHSHANLVARPFSQQTKQRIEQLLKGRIRQTSADGHRHGTRVKGTRPSRS